MLFKKKQIITTERTPSPAAYYFKSLEKWNAGGPSFHADKPVPSDLQLPARNRSRSRRMDGGRPPACIAELARESNGRGCFWWLTAPPVSTLLVPVQPGWTWLNSTVLPSSLVSKEEIGSDQFLKSMGILCCYCATAPPIQRPPSNQRRGFPD